MGLRYGLLAALTLVLACALLWDRLHPPITNQLLPRDLPSQEDLAVLVTGGAPEPLPPPPPPSPLPGALPPAPGAPPAAEEYVVEKGDSLSLIAGKTMGSPRRAAELARHNGLSLESPIHPGQVLRIPPPPSAAPSPAPAPGPAAGPPAPRAPAPPTVAAAKGSHRVGKGDTLYSLARRYYGDGKRFRDIAEANGLDPADPLPVGKELRIP